MHSKKLINFSKFSFAILSLLVGTFLLAFVPYILNKTNVQSYEINDMEELKNALAEEGTEKVITLNSDLFFNETIAVSNNVSIQASKNVTIKRAEGFDGQFFTVGTNGTLTFSSTDGNILFDGQKILTSSPAISNVANSSVTLGEGVEFKDFIGQTNGIVAYNNKGTLIIAGASIHDNEVKRDNDKEQPDPCYGVLYANADSTFYFNSGEFYSNKTGRNGAIFIQDRVVAEFNGGKIYQNDSSEVGSPIYIRGAQVKFGAVKIYENKCSTGTIHIVANGNVVADGIEVTNNTADSYSGGFYLSDTATLTLKTGKINNNTSAKSGGAVFVDNLSTFIMDGGEISGNKVTNEAGSNGGAINSKSRVVINNGTFKDNTATLRGGAIYGYVGDLKDENMNKTPITEINGGRFEGNKVTLTDSTARGGAICIFGNHTLKITGGEFIKNSSQSHAGAISFEGAEMNATISGATFTQNTAVKNGGALYVGSSSSSTVSNCHFIENTSNARGGGAYFTTTCKTTLDGNEFISNSASEGGAICSVCANNAIIKNTTATSNSSTTHGGAFYFTDSSVTTLENNIVKQNTSPYGGGLFSSSTGLLTINGDNYEENQGTSSTSGGGGLSFTKNTNTVLNNVKAINNTSNYRGDDFYAYGENKSGVMTYSTVEVNDGEFTSIGIQYAHLKMGGDVKVSDKLYMYAGKYKDFGFLEITKELENPLNIEGVNAAVAVVEKDTETLTAVRYTATDPWSNIYRQARKLSIAKNESSKGQLVFRVVNNKLLIKSATYGVNIAEGLEMAVDAPTSAETGTQVEFSVLPEYQISDVKVTGTENVQINDLGDGKYSFTMPTTDVTISYTVTKIDLPLEVDESVQGLITVNPTYQYKDDVNVELKDQFDKRITSLLVDLKNDQTLDILQSRTFKMFMGARIYGTTVPYFTLSQMEESKILNLQFEGSTDAHGTSKACENDQITFTFDIDYTGNNSRYLLQRVYYIDNLNAEINLTPNNGVYSFTMPAYNVEIKFEFIDLLEDLQGNVEFVGNENELNEALSTSGKTIVIYNQIELTQTLIFNEGQYSLIGVHGGEIIRGQALKGNMLEVGFGTTLNLGINDITGTALVLNGNGEVVEDINGSILSCVYNGVVNIYDGVEISNNILKQRNLSYDKYGKGKEDKYTGYTQCGGAGVFIHYGIVNMYGGEICNNHIIGNFDGAGVFDYGALNLYGGSINNNTISGTDAESGSGAGVYLARDLTMEGGSIENNSVVGGGWGGGVYMYDTKYSYLFMREGLIKGNTSQRSGGGIFVSTLSTCFIHGGTIEGNSVTSTNGGGINSRGNLYIYGGTFKNNTAKGNGGAIYQYLSSSEKGYKPVIHMAIHGGVFEGNSAAYGGAIAFIGGVRITVDGGEFKGNTASKRGAVFYLGGSEKGSDSPTTVQLTNITLPDDNTCQGNGGIIGVQYAVLKIGENVTINGTIKVFADLTETDAYILFTSNFEEETQFVFDHVNYTKEEVYSAFLKFAEGVNGEALVKNIKIKNQEFGVKFEDGKIVVYKLEELEA